MSQRQREVADVDVVIVGAGPAGIGMALALDPLDGLDFRVFDAGRIGESFRRWPKETRFITPSFHSSPFGLADLNAVNAISSPAIFAGAEHLTGEQYADYLSFIAEAHALPIEEGCKVGQAEPLQEGGFLLTTPQGKLRTRFLIWATGEFLFPDLAPFPGAQWCTHYARVTSWAHFDAPVHAVIGGYESGVDAAVNLIRLGHRVHLLARKSTWSPDGPYDPSLALSPYSRERLIGELDSGRLEVDFGVDVVSVTRSEHGGFRIRAADDRRWDVAERPILGTGFLRGGGANQIADLWDWSDKGHIELTEGDESTRTPGLFLVGPQVRHDRRIFCFIYKFRQRFGLVAEEIAFRLGLDAGALQSGDGVWGPFGNRECCEGCEC